jgi:hypothetical protein
MRTLRILIALLVPASAFAQSTPLAKGGARGQSFTLTKQNHTAAEDTARARFAAGDCNGAIDAFDIAIGHSIDPTLYRDRGICHEKLGHPFPAIDDYRWYLSATPHAKDADDIQERLARLEGHAPPKEASPEDDAAAKAALKGRTITEVERDSDKKEEAGDSSLRLGQGFVVGGYFGLREIGSKFFQFGQRAGAGARWSFDAHNTVLLELGWHWTEADRPLGSNGIETQLGYELRVAFDPYGTHSFILGATAGYERFVTNASNIALNALAFRGRAGYRLVIGKSFGLELMLDGGPLVGWSETGGSAQVIGSIGMLAGLVVGF